MQGLTAIEWPVWRAMNHGWTHPVLDSIMIHATSNDTWIVVGIALSLIASIYSRTRTTVIVLMLIVVALGITDAVCFYALKPIFHRLRPCYEWSNVVRLVVARCGSDYGFPSNHAANSGAIVAVLFGVTRNRLVLVVGVPVALLVAYSRVYVGVHYPLDAIGGMIVGMAIAWGVVTTGDLLKGWRKEQKDIEA